MNQMNQNEKNAKQMLTKTFLAVREWILDHSKIIMPLVLVVCVLITVLLAVNANKKSTLEDEARLAAATAVEQVQETPEAVEEVTTKEVPLEENAHQDINNVIKTYYDAQASGDIETISGLNTYLNDIEKIRVEELSKYIDSYPVLDVYTKPGLTENTYIAYVYSEVKFSDVEKNMPGMQTYYIGQNEAGDYFINDGTYDDEVWSYIKEVTLQDDVVDLNNKVVVKYNELLAEDEETGEFIAYLKEKINEDVGEILADAEQPQEETPAEDAGEDPMVASSEEGADETQDAEGGDAPQTETQVIRKAKATDVVNIRSSDSETADKLDKAQIGQEFTVLEQKGNGWSKVKFEGRDAYIKSDYLEIISEETVEVDVSNVVAGESVKVLENVRIRTEANTDSESLGTAYTGEKLEFVEKLSSGWTKVKYKGHTAYVKSEYVE